MRDITNKIKIHQLDWNDERTNGYYNCPYVWSYKGKEIILGAGTSDDLYFILHDDHLLLMSVNSRMDYVGIEVYNDNLEMVVEKFVQSVNDGYSPLFGRRDFFSYTWYTQARKLYNLAMETL